MVIPQLQASDDLSLYRNRRYQPNRFSGRTKSPPRKAGLKSGDVLTEFGGQKIDRPADFDRLKYVHDEGEKVTVTVMRGKEIVTQEVTLEAMK